MRRLLKVHPLSCTAPVSRIEVEVSHLYSDKINLSYLMIGKMSDVAFPVVQTPARTGELWRQTCFEAFLRPSNGSEYYEFNFSPSSEWAAYRFTKYRTGRREVANITAIQIHARLSSVAYTLQTSLALDQLSGQACGTSWHLGLSAVVEDISGRKAYWALEHPPGEPDFHHIVCFAHEFSPGVST
jgi:hypothetical protein